jgi:hypothetical protein
MSGTSHANLSEKSQFYPIDRIRDRAASATGIGLALSQQSEHLAQRYAGFVSASVQVSDDGRRVLSLLQWQSREAGEAAFCRYESGEQDFWQLIRAHQAKTVTFNSFQVLSSIARSHDDALHCNLVG